ncbi:hypothetical protein [Streptomyces geysiriensis]|uniref:hypothetical protein n=1 Tax=Streptomyces geysiriensis TaxID=68207 RepID=UPI00217696BA|nr:hypothetical protein [Streptomyces geysiriensis]
MAWHSRPRALRGPGTVRPPGVPALWPHLDLLGDFGGRRGAGRHVEQLVWRWHGPLDTERFAAAWQSVVDRESVLRAALAPGPGRTWSCTSTPTATSCATVRAAPDGTGCWSGTAGAASIPAAPARCASPSWSAPTTRPVPGR